MLYSYFKLKRSEYRYLLSSDVRKRTIKNERRRRRRVRVKKEVKKEEVRKRIYRVVFLKETQKKRKLRRRSLNILCAKKFGINLLLFVEVDRIRLYIVPIYKYIKVGSYLISLKGENKKKHTHTHTKYGEDRVGYIGIVVRMYTRIKEKPNLKIALRILRAGFYTQITRTETIGGNKPLSNKPRIIKIQLIQYLKQRKLLFKNSFPSESVFLKGRARKKGRGMKGIKKKGV